MLNGDEDIEMGRIPDEADGEASGLESVGEPPGEFSLTTRVVRGGAWVFAGKVAGRGLQVIKLVVLARLLVPEDFGLFGIVMLAMAAIETLTTTGFEKALIQRRDDARAHLDTAWTVQILRGLVIAVLLFAGAPLVAWFFGEPRAVTLLRVLCLAKVISGFRNIGIMYWQKEIEFHRHVVFEFAIAVVSVAVGITLAVVLRNVWALVWSTIAGSATGAVLSYAMHPYRPRLRLDLARAGELFGYGKWLLGSSALIYLGSKLDNIIVAKLLGTAFLGFYVMAYRLSVLPLRETTYAVSGVLVPGYAKVQDDPIRLNRSYKRALGITALLSVPLCFGMLVLAVPIIELMLGGQWLPIVRILQILMVAQLIKGVVSTGSPLFLGTGHPRYEFHAQLARTIVLSVWIVPSVLLYGLEGAALAVLSSAIAMFVVYARAVRHLVDDLAAVCRDSLLPPLAGAVAMAGLLAYPAFVLTKYERAIWVEAIILAILIIIGAAVYFLVCLGVARCFPNSTIPADVASILGRVRALFGNERLTFSRHSDNGGERL